MSTVAVTDETFRTEVIGSDIPVLVDFWAPWCQPCLLLAPVLEELATTYAGRVKIAKVDTDTNPQLTAVYGIVSIPTLTLFRDGELVRSIVGGRPKREIVDQLEQLLAPQ